MSNLHYLFLGVSLGFNLGLIIIVAILLRDADSWEKRYDELCASLEGDGGDDGDEDDDDSHAPITPFQPQRGNPHFVRN